MKYRTLLATELAVAVMVLAGAVGAAHAHTITLAPSFQELLFDARGISADGSVVVGCSVQSCGGGSQAISWTANGGIIGLGTLPNSNSTFALGTNADGTVIVGGSSRQAYRWTAGGRNGWVGLSARRYRKHG
jgi:probable HAF family extracellular repeat protein